MTGIELLRALDAAEPAYVQQAEESVRRPRRRGMLLLAAAPTIVLQVGRLMRGK